MIIAINFKTQEGRTCLSFLLTMLPVNDPIKVLALGLNVGYMERPCTWAILAYRSEMVRPMSPNVKHFLPKSHKKFRVPISKSPQPYACQA